MLTNPPLMRRGLLIVLLLALTGTVCAAQEDLDTRLAPLAEKNVTARALLLMKDKRDTSQLNRAVSLLQQHLIASPEDRTAKMFCGYGQLFLAGDYMLKKNYMRAAELSKQGYYAIDEAAEQEPENALQFYLRARMNAFVPAESGRCVVANKDLNALQSPLLPTSLTPMLTLMRARAAMNCNQPEKAAQAWNALRAMGAAGEPLYRIQSGAPPDWTSGEILDVLVPLLEAQP
ncbi:hypothetical protein AAGR22_18805 [Erwinia sp. HDF1-3R]|uniref:hypothetical protein n=1 Tax=Erwinia sp. HDF1-3R TaxID=3141543 RepID=UPI0031F5927A